MQPNSHQEFTTRYQHQLPLNFAMMGQMQLPQNYQNYAAYAGQNLQLRQDNARMVEYLRQMAMQNAEHMVAVPQAAAPPPPRVAPAAAPAAVENIQNTPDFRVCSIPQIASYFNVYVSSAIISEAESLMSLRTTSPRTLAKLLLRKIIGDDVILNQKLTKTRHFQGADLPILSAVEAIVNSRYDEERHIDITCVFSRLADYLREKRRDLAKKNKKAEGGEIAGAVKRSYDSGMSAEEVPSPPQYQNPPQTYPQPVQQPLVEVQQNWSRPTPAKRAYLQPPMQTQPPPPVMQTQPSPPVMQAQTPPTVMQNQLAPQVMQYPRYYPMANYPFYPNGWSQQQQAYWSQVMASHASNNCYPPQTAPTMYFPPPAASSNNGSPGYLPLSPNSLQPSTAGSPDLQSPGSGNLEICELDDEEEEEEEDEEVEEQGGSQGSQPFSQEWWELQSQQHQFYQS